MTEIACPVCNGDTRLHRNVDGFDYHECDKCGLIFIDPWTLGRIDAGESLVEYSDAYWDLEIPSAIERSRSLGIARMAEAIYLARRPVHNVIDIGSGTGRLLDAFEHLLPANSAHVFGVELHPPPRERTASHNFIVGHLGDLSPRIFDAGLCMEMIEHMTPKMVSDLLGQLAAVASDNACFLFNTGLAEFARTEDPGYLDPRGRGHIVAWTVKAISILAEPHGLKATALPGRNWAFLVEKTSAEPASIESRIYAPLPENLVFLGDGEPGLSLLSVLASEAARNYFYADLASQRTLWALAMQKLFK